MRKIEVIPFQTAWKHSFQQESDILKSFLSGCLISLEHAGSTAIPGMTAKPTIDMFGEVSNLDVVDALSPQFIKNGYTPRGENGIIGRRYFFKGTAEQHTFHLHLYLLGNPEIQRHLAFRDYLIAHPLEAESYSLLKQELAKRFTFDPVAYTEAKSSFIREIDQKAAKWLDNLKSIQDADL